MKKAKPVNKSTGPKAPKIIKRGVPRFFPPPAKKAWVAPERLRGTIHTIIAGKGYGFVVDESGYEHWLHEKKMARYPGSFMIGTVIEFTPGQRDPLEQDRPAPCSDVVVVLPK